MGNEDSYSSQPPANFPMNKYLNQGLTQAQVLQVYAAFMSYNPVENKISVQTLKGCTVNSGSHTEISKFIDGKGEINFDEFFVMSKTLLQEQIQRNPTMIIDSEEVNASCLFCPYAVDKQ